MKKYFLAANSAEGFVSYFGESYDIEKGYRAYIIKGGPGTGKSSFMKYTAKKAEDKGYTVTYLPCSSDPDSLDGIIIEEMKTVMLDGTAPHVVEPEFAGVCEEIINLGEFWKGSALRKNADAILSIMAENQRYHKTASAYFRASGGLIFDSFNLSRGFCDHTKLNDYSESLCRRLIPPKNTGDGYEWVRFLRGNTPKGVMFYKDTLTPIQNKIIIEDKYGAVSAKIMAVAREIALSRGYEIISVKNSFLPSVKYDHIIIPELSLAFISEDDYGHIDDTSRRIHARRFYDLALLKRHRERLAFNKKAAGELLYEGCVKLSEAKAVHDELEKYYINAMDFKALTAFCEIKAEEIIDNN